MQQGRSPAQLGAPADAQDMGVSPGSLQSPLPPASPPASDRAVAACTSRAPRSPARPRLHSAAGGSRCFHYTLSRRREGVKLLFLFLQCKICQLGTVDRLPLCHCSGSFNCLPCVRATVCVCARVPCKGLVCSLARLLACTEKELIPEHRPAPGASDHDPNLRETMSGGDFPLWELGNWDSGLHSSPYIIVVTILLMII